MDTTPKGLSHWLPWIDNLISWHKEAPKEVKMGGFYDVENVAYQDLAEISEHFQVYHNREDYKHRQWVQLELDSENELTFYSPSRSFSYHEITD